MYKKNYIVTNSRNRVLELKDNVLIQGTKATIFSYSAAVRAIDRTKMWHLQEEGVSKARADYLIVLLVSSPNKQTKKDNTIDGLSNDPSEAYAQGKRDGQAEIIHAKELYDQDIKTIHKEEMNKAFEDTPILQKAFTEEKCNTCLHKKHAPDPCIISDCGSLNGYPNYKPKAFKPKQFQVNLLEKIKNHFPVKCSICNNPFPKANLQLERTEGYKYQIVCPVCKSHGPECSNFDEAISHWNNLHEK